jgi:hypothetical protein
VWLEILAPLHPRLFGLAALGGNNLLPGLFDDSRDDISRKIERRR